MKKTQHVRPITDRRNPDLHGYLYLPLDRRKQRNESVLSGLHRRKRRFTDGDGKVKPAKKTQSAGYDQLYDLRELPCSDYQRMYEI